MIAYLLLALVFTATPTRVVGVWGQSNGNGTGGTPVFSTSQTGENVAFTGNLLHTVVDQGCGAVGSTQVAVDAWPLVATVDTGGTEKPRTHIGKVYYERTGNSVLSVTAASAGYSFACASPYPVGGGAPTATWQQMVNGVTSAQSHSLAKQNGTAMTALGLVSVHGEADEGVTTATAYQANMVTLWTAWQTLVNLRLGVNAISPLYMVQENAWTYAGYATPTSAYGMVLAAKANPTRLYVVGPSYQDSYYSDGVHRDAQGHCANGSRAGHVIADYGSSWAPLWMTGATRSGTTVTVTTNVPVCPMVFDTTTVSNPGNYGFEYYCTSSPPTITSVTNTSCSGNVGTITIGLSGTPDATCQSNDVIRVAWTGTPGAKAGPTTGPRANVRDSDPVTTVCDSNTVNLYNWIVTGSENVI